MYSRLVFGILWCVFSCAVYAQDSLLYEVADDVVISATRIETEQLKLPVSAHLVKVDPSQPEQAFSLRDLSLEVPGMLALNQYNSAQDLRISIRGFGARSAFGIRGVKMILDGIPISTPDGQAQVDNIFVGGLKKMEVINGTASALYGNAAGGVVNLSSFNDLPDSKNVASLSYGSFQNVQTSLEMHHVKEKVIYDFQAYFNDFNGFRDHAESRNFIANGRIKLDFGNLGNLSIITNYLWSPIGNDPGGVNLEQVSMDRSSARDANISFNGGESLWQLSNALQYRKDFNEETGVQAKVFLTRRDFENRLPFRNGGQVDLERNYSGVILQLNHHSLLGNWDLDWLAGGEFLSQEDQRMRYNNENGERADLSLDQQENFVNAAAYLSLQASFEKLLFNAGMRFDQNWISVEDDFTLDGVQDGKIVLPAVSPSLSWSYNFYERNYLFAAFSYGFETPTLSELSNRPDNAGGFNPDLRPLKAYTYELGYKSMLQRNWYTTVTLFAVNSEDELLPYELEEFPGRTFYRNAGRTDRQGVEVSIRGRIAEGLTIGTSYAFSDFFFEEFLDFEGNRLPGIPRHNLNVNIAYERDGWQFSFDHQYLSTIFADNANQVEIPFMNIGSLSMSKQVGRFHPFLGINNLYGAEYYDNIRINAFGGRYYEAAPPRNYYIGLKVEF